MQQRFGLVTGLSDHTLDIEVPITSVLLGGHVIEKAVDQSALKELKSEVVRNILINLTLSIYIILFDPMIM